MNHLAAISSEAPTLNPGCGACLRVEPTSAHAHRQAIDDRRVVRVWTSAASSPSWLAAAVECVGRFLFTRQAAPQWLVRQFNNYAGILHCAALVLALSTFHDFVKGAAVTAYTDNQGVLGAVVAVPGALSKTTGLRKCGC